MRRRSLLFGYATLVAGLALILLVTTAMTRGGGSDRLKEPLYGLPANFLPDSVDPVARMEMPAEQVYKNIKVLKGLKAREVMGAMEFMENALGVGCNFCHVQGNFASDDKPQKETARSMMHMVNDINQRSFSVPTVTCNTCHHGQPRPDAVPSVHQKEWKETDIANAADIIPDSTTTVDQIVSRYIDALGGKEALGRVNNRTMKLSQRQMREGRRETEEGRSTVMILYQTSDGKFYSRMPLNDPRQQGGELLRGYDGRVAWVKHGNRSAGPIFNDAMAMMIRSGELFPAMRLKTDYTDVKLLGKSIIDEQGYYVVSATARDHSIERLYFNIESGLLIRRYVNAPTPLGNIPFSIEFSDYQEVDGVKIPHTIKWSGARESWIDTVKEIHQNVPSDASMFRMPGA